MEKRLILAVLLMSAVILVTNILFPPPEEPVAGTGPDSARITAPPPAPPAMNPAALVAPAGPDAGAPRTVTVRSPLYRYAFSTRGAALVLAELREYPSYTAPDRPVQLVPGGAAGFLTHRLVVSGDTIDLRGARFQPGAPSLSVDSASGPQSLRFSFGNPGAFGLELTYTFHPDSYVIDVRGRLTGVRGGATLLTDVGPGLAPHEAMDHHSERELAFVTRTLEDVDRTPLRKIDRRAALEGPLTWAGIKDKYFLAAIVANDSAPLSGVLARRLSGVSHPFVDDGDTTVVEFPSALVTTALPIAADGAFAFRAYLGPQDYDLLAAVGSELEDATPYGYRWMQPVIRPFAAFILYILNFLHQSLGLAYGWVLVVFGVMMRVVLWPLNAKAMRSQMKNAAVAPRMQEIREKHKDNPQKQQEEILRLYKEEGFNPMAGCLPMLIPFPVLITLFFVFQNTIGFRGAEFLWLPDLSLRDPWNILPVFLVISMFALQWVSTKMSGMEQNPQMKMMMYVMPLMVGVLFFSLPSGLNLYYAATNVASLPQQIMIARERRRTQDQPKPATPSVKPSVPPRNGRERKRRGRG